MITSEIPVFTKSNYPLAMTDSFDRLIIDYVNDSKLLKEFYNFDDSLNGIQERINTYENFRLNRKNLKDVIFRQYNSGDISMIPSVVQENINSLEDKKTFTVTTGHQLNIFSGPLYVFYKLISVISLSNYLNKTLSKYHFIPVYWMATEDHDMEEISTLNIFGNNFKWNSSWKGMSGKAPVGDLQPLIEELKNVLGASPNSNELNQIINESYSTTSNLADATRKWINSFFGKYGLVIVDGNDSILKTQFEDVIKDDLIKNSASALIAESTAKLKENYHLQVNPREINLFYADQDFRKRIVFLNDHYEVVDSDIKFSSEQILNEIKIHPEKFSPNVVLRPLYQETILPNIIYTGGPAEIAYWLELKSVFNYYKIPMPVLFMRSSGMIIDNSTNAILQKYAIHQTDIFKSIDELIRKYIRSTDNISVNAIVESLSAEMDQLTREAVLLDSTLRSTVESEKQRMLNSLHVLEQKIIRAAKKKNETDINKIRKLKDKLFPGSKLQEREVAALTYLLQWGHQFTDILLKHLDPMEKEFTILEERSA